MTLSKQHVHQVVDIYIQAWETQDPDLIVTIFTENGIYHERVLAAPMHDHQGIREYWKSKVVESQRNIECRLLNLYLDGDTAIAEWEALFDDLSVGSRKRMREVAILEFDGPLIASLREYWASEELG